MEKPTMSVSPFHHRSDTKAPGQRSLRFYRFLSHLTVSPLSHVVPFWLILPKLQLEVDKRLNRSCDLYAATCSKKPGTRPGFSSFRAKLQLIPAARFLQAARSCGTTVPAKTAP